MTDKNELSVEGKEYLAKYTEYNHTLRAWFVAFGVGGPVTFLINDILRAELIVKGVITEIAVLFLIGAGAQIFIALINKISNWCSYYAETNSEFKDGYINKFFSWLVRQFWIDVILDLLTIYVFGKAIWTLITIFAI